MSTSLAAPSTARGTLSGAIRTLRPVLPALLIGLFVIGVLFKDEAAAAVRVWNESTAYSHCWFVLPIALYLGWERRHLLNGETIRPEPSLVWLAVPLAIAWLAAERLGIMEGRQLVAIGFVQLLAACVLGPRMWWALSAPLLYLFFLVPFGAFLTPALQTFTAGFVKAGLNVLGIPNVVDTYTIEIPEGVFYVAEACAGLRFLIASVAFGVLYSFLIYTSMRRRLMFMAASIVIPIIANGFRALGIVVLGHVLGSAQAAATDHILYGWIFFSIVIVLLILAGLPFRQDTPVPRGVRIAVGMAPFSPAYPLLAVAALCMLTAAGPAAATMLDMAADTPLGPVTAPFAAVPGCLPSGASGPAVLAPVPQARGAVVQLLCGQDRVVALVIAVPPRSNPALMQAVSRLVTLGSAAEEVQTGTLDVERTLPHRWRLTETETPGQSTATALWINGQPAVGGIMGRLTQAWNSIAGSDSAPLLVALSVPIGNGPVSGQQRHRASDLLRAILERQPDLPARMTELAHKAASGS